MFKLREPRADELAALSALCLRSKALWGYDDAFLAACARELTIGVDDLTDSFLQVAEDGDGPVGVAQLAVAGGEAGLEKLFIEPARMRTGAGRALFDWAVRTAKANGAKRLIIEADPGAAAFYRRMGAREDGTAPSGSIAGRSLPRLVLDL